jgi:two-component system chemotaxis response regulator CheB
VKQIRVLVVDDSAVVRQVVSAQLKTDPSITVIAAVADPIFAMERMRKEWPDVIVLDVEMPRMDGLTFLRKIMAERPTPVVICSTLTEKGAVTTLEALAAGAVSIVTKPKIGLKRFLEDATADLICAVKEASQVNMSSLKATLAAPGTIRTRVTVATAPAAKNSADVITGAPALLAMKQTTERIVALGTSTGGTQALERVLTVLPRACPGIAVVQHMPEKFTAAFAARLNGICDVEVREAANGERLLPGLVLIAPGGRHLMLRRGGAITTRKWSTGPSSIVTSPPWTCCSGRSPSVPAAMRSASS